MNQEAEWQNEVYDAAAALFDRDPDRSAEVVSDQMVTAALRKLVEILEEQRPRDCVVFIRNITA